MILYFSGRCCGTYDIASRPETILKKKKACIMMSYTYTPKEDIKRFKTYKKEKKKGTKKWE